MALQSGSSIGEGLEANLLVTAITKKKPTNVNFDLTLQKKEIANWLGIFEKLY